MVDANFTHNSAEVTNQVTTPKVDNPYNPFNPTARDYQRTQKLANKSILALVIGGLLLSPVASSLYLWRGANHLKILAYTFLAAFAIGVTFAPEDPEIDKIGKGLGAIGSVVVVAEQVNAVKKARKRQSEANQEK